MQGEEKREEEISSNGHQGTRKMEGKFLPGFAPIRILEKRWGRKARLVLELLKFSTASHSFVIPAQAGTPFEARNGPRLSPG
jgi:hypothetical protein